MVFAAAARPHQTLARHQSAVGAAVFEFPPRGVTLHRFEAFFASSAFRRLAIASRQRRQIRFRSSTDAQARPLRPSPVRTFPE